MIINLFLIRVTKLKNKAANTIPPGIVAQKIFGLTLLSGFSIKNEGLAVDGNNQLVRVMSSELLSFVPTLMLISIVLIDKATKSELGKHIINFLCLAVCFVYILLLPVIAPTSFLTEDYINLANFERIAGYWINFAFICVAFIYFTVVSCLFLNETSHYHVSFYFRHYASIL